MTYIKSLQKIYTGFKIQKNVLRALVYRELKTRVATAKFGLIGVIVEPTGTLFIFLTIFSFFRIRNSYGLDLFIFLGTGFLFFRSFREIVRSSLGALEANHALLFYKQIKPIDTVISRCFVLFSLNLIVYIILIFISFLRKEYFYIDDFPTLITVFLLLGIFSLTVSIFFLILGSKLPWLSGVAPFMFRPLFFTSGVLFSLNQVPKGLQPFLTWNPILHAIEIGRHSFTKEYPLSEAISISYILKLIIILLPFSLLVYERNKHQLFIK